MAPRVVAIFGATASGKSDVAGALAQRVGGELVCADAMQLYAGLDILTNAPTPEERERVPHHLFGTWPTDETGGVGAFAELAHSVIDEILRRGRTPIVVGGTGLYLRAAIGALQLPPAASSALRARIAAEVADLGPAAAHAILAERDPAAAARLHPHDRQRVVRALELSELGSSLAPDNPGAFWDSEPRHPTILAAIRIPRPVLHDRIAARSRSMFERGVVEEVRASLAATTPSPTAARALGLEIVISLLDGEIDRKHAIELLTIRTRQYARRQETWLRRLPGRHDLDGTRSPESVAAELAALASGG